jgi:hypothetical protein
MKEELGDEIGTMPDSAASGEASAARPRRTRRRPARKPSDGGPVRYFLSNGDGSGTPVLDQEFKNESEAMLESLKTGKSYFVVSEWRGTADLSKKLPQIRKEAVTGNGS